MMGATELTLPGMLREFAHRLPANVAYMQIQRQYLWDRHVTLKAFWRLALQGFAIGDLTPLTKWLWIGSAAIVGACLFAAVIKLRKQPDQISRDRLIAVTIVCMPLLMPFYFDYDLLLLSAAAVLVAREQLTTGQRLPWPMLAGWSLLYGWTIFNPSVATATHVNGTVLLVALNSWLLIRRALRRETAGVATLAPPPTSRRCEPPRERELLGARTTMKLNFWQWLGRDPLRPGPDLPDRRASTGKSDPDQPSPAPASPLPLLTCPRRR
jgi:hypothetical protein